MSLGSKKFYEKSENETKRANIHASVLGHNFPKPAIVSQSEGMRSSVAEQVVVHLVPTTRLLLPLAALCKFMHKPLLATKQVKVHA